MRPDNAYDSLAEASSDHGRWAYGTGFEDPLAGVDTDLPAGVDLADLAEYCLMLGDDALVMSHRLQEWLTLLPELEEEVAIANVALDLLGQARLLLSRAAQTSGGRTDEDAYAFRREQHEWRNVRLVERADADFAELVVRLLVFSTWRLSLMGTLQGSVDPVLAAIAAKAVKELAYHRDFAAQWVIRLGDGTDESHRRTEAALAAVWPWVDELFRPSAVEDRLHGVVVDPASLRPEFDSVMDAVLAQATLAKPTGGARAGVAGRTGRDGMHTEALGWILAEMQSIPRAHPEATW